MNEQLEKSLIRYAAVALAASASLSGCTVGPDFAAPGSSTPQEWSSLRSSASTRPITSTPVNSPAEARVWWETFNDVRLTSLIERSTSGNLTLAQAESRVRQARAERTIAGSGMYPGVNASASATRGRNGGTFGASTSNQFRAGFDASWELDVFGGIRRGVEAADAQIESAVYDRQSLMVTLSGEVATTYFELRGAQRQLVIAQHNQELQQHVLELTQQRFDAGFVSALDVANARANVTQTEAQVPSFDAQVQSSIYALSTLLGQQPGALLDELQPQESVALLPSSVPVGLPSELLRRRPDIKRAEADLHASTARVGIAVADQYPRFSLTSSFGTQGNKVASLGTLADRFWSIGPGISLPVFTGGRIEGNIEAAKAVAEQATLAYRQSVLVALQDVETSIVNFTREQQRRAALAESAAANAQAADLAVQLYNAGRTDFLNVLSAQRQLYSTQAQLVQSETAVASDLVAIYKAIGGGWDESLTIHEKPEAVSSP